MRSLTLISVIALFIGISLSSPIYSKSGAEYLHSHPSELNKLLDDWKVKHNYDALKSDFSGKDDDEDSKKRNSRLPVVLPDAASYPLWYLNINQTGTSRFVFNNQGPRDVSNIILSPFIPVRTIIRQSTQEWFTGDAVASQYTFSGGSVMWTTTLIGGVLTTICVGNRTATFSNQQMAHNSIYRANLGTYVDTKVRLGKSKVWFDSIKKTYFFNGLSNDFGGTSNGTMDFYGFFDVYDLTPYQFGFDQPQVTARTPYGVGVCTHNIDNVAGEYKFNDENAGFFPVTSASILDLVDASCHPNGDKSIPINFDYLPNIDDAWCGQ